ncbi:MAG: YbaN family protein [Bacteroidales bacterium]
MRKFILIFWGTISLILGIIGILVPGLPTTPFLLLTAALYLKGSERLYNRLINNRYLGGYIKNYYEQKGMTLIQKISSISVMWIMILLSCYAFIELKSIQLVIGFLGITGTVVMTFFVPTAKKDH